MLATSALTISTVLAAGTIVDVGARAEGRASILSEQVADGFGNSLMVVGVTPSIRAAYEGQGLVLDGNYAPNLSVIYPSSDYFLAMHRWGGRVDWTATPRLRLSADVNGALGDLDAGAAVRDVGGRAGAVLGGGNLTQFPFADVVAGGTAVYRWDPRITLTFDTRVEGTGSPTPGEDEELIIPPQVRPEATAGWTYLLTPTDSLTLNLLLKGAAIADKRGVLGNGGSYVGLTPSLAYNHTIMNGVVTSTRAGWLTAVVDEAKGRDALLHGLPLLDERLTSSVNLSGEAAIEGTLLFGVGPFSDPLGGLLEERISAGVQGAWRVNRDLTFTTSATAFGTLYAIGGNALIAQEAQTSVGGSFGVAYNLTEWVSVTAEGLGTTRVISDKFGALAELRPEMTVVVGISGAFNLFHEGVRPAGTDPRPGRSVGTRVVGLPGSAKAFNGKDDDKDKKKKKERSSFRQDRELGKPDDELDEDDVLDRRRRGLTVDEKRLKKRKAEAAEEEEKKEEEKNDEDKDKDKDKKGKDSKKDAKKGKSSRRSSSSSSSTFP
jgi:hypothetical protein